MGLGGGKDWLEEGVVLECFPPLEGRSETGLRRGLFWTACPLLRVGQRLAWGGGCFGLLASSRGAVGGLFFFMGGGLLECFPPPLEGRWEAGLGGGRGVVLECFPPPRGRW